MSDNVAIRVSNLTKKFKVYYDKGRSLKEVILFRNRNKHEVRTVLDDVSFDIKKGEAVGLIGHNGCGKSTLLKLISGILYPDGGSVNIEGRVSSLLELGAGFHPDMSGRENIYINASIFGLTKEEIEARLQTIIDFSELAGFIDNPVRTYSSGMYMRLAFSVAINVDADVLLIDEILAVGDANFQAKCFAKLQEIKEKGTTIVIVSHSLSQIENICDRSIWINEGKIRADGTPLAVHSEYLDFMNEQRQAAGGKALDIPPEYVAYMQERRYKENLKLSMIPEQQAAVEANGGQYRWGSGEVKITSITASGPDGVGKRLFEVGSDVYFKVHYHVEKPIKDAVFGIGFFRNSGENLYGTNTRIDGHPKFDLNEDGEFTIIMRKIPLMPDQYTVSFSIEYGDGIPVDYWKDALKIDTYRQTPDVGGFFMEHDWEYKATKEDLNG